MPHLSTAQPSPHSLFQDRAGTPAYSRSQIKHGPRPSRPRFSFFFLFLHGIAAFSNSALFIPAAIRLAPNLLRAHLWKQVPAPAQHSRPGRHNPRARDAPGGSPLLSPPQTFRAALSAKSKSKCKKVAVAGTAIRPARPARSTSWLGTKEWLVPGATHLPRSIRCVQEEENPATIIVGRFPFLEFTGQSIAFPLWHLSVLDGGSHVDGRRHQNNGGDVHRRRQ